MVVDVVGIYPGPTVIARTPDGVLHVEADEIVVATGTAEIQPVCPGNDLDGLLTPRAAQRLRAAGIAVPEPEVSVGRELVRFEGDAAGRVATVVTRGVDGAERAHAARTVIVDLGRTPRDLLARMAGPDAHVSTVGEAADAQPLPPAPGDSAATVCRCMGVTVADLDAAWDDGFTELELLKRATLAGIGTCQGGACLPHVRAWIAARIGHRAGAVHRATRRAPADPGRGRRRRQRRRLPADRPPRRAPGARRADGPVRELVAAVALRRRRRGVLGGPAGASRSATCRPSAS